MTNEEKELGQAVLDRVQNNQYSEFSLLTSLQAFKGAKLYRGVIKKVKEGFKAEATRCFNKYLQDAANNKADFRDLLKFRDLRHCYNFYQKEYNIIDDMIDEFRCYLRSNENFIRLRLGKVRTEEEMVDFRTLPLSLF